MSPNKRSRMFQTAGACDDTIVNVFLVVMAAFVSVEGNRPKGKINCLPTYVGSIPLYFFDRRTNIVCNRVINFFKYLDNQIV
jgi:hypothetical protein